jgi:hypothetical protein
MAAQKLGMERRKLNQSLKAGGLDPTKQARQERRLAFVNRKIKKSRAPANSGQRAMNTMGEGNYKDAIADATRFHDMMYVAGRDGPRQGDYLGIGGATNHVLPTTDTPRPMDQAVQATPNDNSALFPNQRAFEFQNWQGSPLYQFQRDEGLKAIDRKLAASGLQGSGFQFDQYRNFLTDLGSREAERNSQVAQQEANRLQTMQENESQRRERVSNNAWDRNFSLMELMSRQNPMGYAVQGTSNLGDAYGTMANKRYDYLSSQYPRVSGGGGYVPPPYLPPPASGPDYSGFNAQQVQNGAVQNNNWYNALISGLGGIYNTYQQNNK